MPRGRIYKQPTKPLHISVPLDLHTLLMEFAELSRTPASRFVTLLLVENQPVIEEMVVALRKANAGLTHPLQGLNRLMYAKINEAVAIQAKLKGGAVDEPNA